jgi:transposase
LDYGVRSYKGLSDVERAFRALKTVDLKVRPIRHWLEDRVRALIFLCLLTYYVEWHVREAWRELLMADEQTAAKAERDPVAPARRSPQALQKIADRILEDVGRGAERGRCGRAASRQSRHDLPGATQRTT